jgi:hypothetical protein
LSGAAFAKLRALRDAFAYQSVRHLSRIGRDYGPLLSKAGGPWFLAKQTMAPGVRSGWVILARVDVSNELLL